MSNIRLGILASGKGSNFQSISLGHNGKSIRISIKSS
jgi:folate-dependent phosphoribosylglycinamide formyltransferase PurN